MIKNLSAMQKNQVQTLSQEDPLEKGMATHSSVLAWRNPWTKNPGCSDGTEFACNAGDLGSIPGLGRSPREGNGYPLQYSCLENSIDRGDSQTTVRGSQRVQT